MAMSVPALEGRSVGVSFSWLVATKKTTGHKMSVGRQSRGARGNFGRRSSQYVGSPKEAHNPSKKICARASRTAFRATKCVLTKESPDRHHVSLPSVPP
eukprot:scaffold172925_cov56-Attheya_sp.AAC.5